MEVKVQGGSAITLNAALFAKEYNEALVHQVLTAYMAGSRAGTRAQKTRADVQGSGAKPWRQKGTGRARVGTAQNPIWRGGGVTFAARPQDWSQKVNKKMYHAAIANVLSELIRTERLIVVEDFSVEAPKTKTVIAMLKDLGVQNEKVLLVVNDLDENLYLSVRNLPYIGLLNPRSLDPVSLVGSDKVVVTKSAIESIQEWLS